MKKIGFLHAATSVVLSQCCALAFALQPLSYAHYDKVKTTDLHMDLKAYFA